MQTKDNIEQNITLFTQLFIESFANIIYQTFSRWCDGLFSFGDGLFLICSDEVWLLVCVATDEALSTLSSTIRGWEFFLVYLVYLVYYFLHYLQIIFLLLSTLQWTKANYITQVEKSKMCAVTKVA